MSKNSVIPAKWSELFGREYLPNLCVLALALWLHATNSMLAATTLPAAVNDIGGVQLISWAFSLYLVGSVVAGTYMSLLVSMFGLQRIMIIATLVYCFGCVVCGASMTMSQFLVGRTLQGIGGGGMVALVYLSQQQFFPARFIPRVIACLSMVWMVSAFFGPIIGGLFSTLGIWRYAFLIFCAQGILLIVGIVYLIPAGEYLTTNFNKRISVANLMALAASILLVSIAGANYTPIVSEILAIAGIGSLLLFVVFDARTTFRRMLPRGVLCLSHPVSSGLLMTLSFSMSLMSFLVFGPILLIRLYSLTPLSAGFVLMIEALAWGAAAILFSGGLFFRTTNLIRIGSVLVTTGVLGQALVVPDTSVLAIAVVLIIASGGFGMMWGHIIQRIVAAANPDDKERAASIMPVTQQIGFALGAALVGLIANRLQLSYETSIEELRTLSPWLFVSFLPIALIGNYCAFRFTTE